MENEKKKEFARSEEAEERSREGYVPSEQVVMADGQLGGNNIERGPERQNPEGTALTPNPPPDRR